MEFRGKVLGKKTLILGIMAILVAMSVSAVIVNYISNSASGTVTVSSPLGLQIIEGTLSPVEMGTAMGGSAPLGLPPQAVTLTSMVGGDSRNMTVRVTNFGSGIINGNLNLTLYGDDGFGNPLGVFTPNIDEFDVVGTRVYDVGAGQYEPFQSDALTCSGGILYWDGTLCWYNVKGMMAGLGGTNPINTVLASNVPFPAGETFAQILVVTNVAIASGDYTLTTQVMP